MQHSTCRSFICVEPFFVVLVLLFLVCEWLNNPAALLGESLWLATDVPMFPSLPAGGCGEPLCCLFIASSAWEDSRGFPSRSLGRGLPGIVWRRSFLRVTALEPVLERGHVWLICVNCWVGGHS
jgi:hypothetical protein